MSSFQKTKAPVIVFGYKRPQHLKITLERLAAADGANSTSVIVFIDGPKNELERSLVDETYNVAMRDYGFANKNVNKAGSNQGLANSIIRGVSKTLESHENVIVLEDDILVGRGFLDFMNKALYKYKDSKTIFSITGYVPKKVGDEIEKIEGDGGVGFSPRPGSWGWATWRSSWQGAKWAVLTDSVLHDKAKYQLDVCGNDVKHMLKLQREGLIDSWAVLWVLHHYMEGGLSLYPSKSFVENIGMDGSGTHTRTTKRYITGSEGLNENIKWPKDISVFPSVMKAFCHSYNRKLTSYIKWTILRLLNRLGIN